MHYTTSCNKQSSAPEDGRDQRLKHIELIEIINKPLLLHLVGVYIIYINDSRSKNIKFARTYKYGVCIIFKCVFWEFYVVIRTFPIMNIEHVI